jgi:hypothetical protein
VSNLASAAVRGAETAAHRAVAEAVHRRSVGAEKDESQERAAAGGALLLGIQSTHQRADRLTVPSGQLESRDHVVGASLLL